MKPDISTTLVPALCLVLCMIDAMPAETQPCAGKLVPCWKTEPVLEVPESVLYNPAEKMLYVSNIVGKPADKDGNGFISKISMGGTIVKLKWADGLDAPKGMAIHGGSLYVSDIDALVQIDLPSGKTTARHPAPGAVFLNDVAAGPDGSIYVGDSSSENSAIYRLHGNKLEVWLKSPSIRNPNGLHVEDGRLLVGNGQDGNLDSVDTATRTIVHIAKTDSGIDGLQPDGNGNHLTSNWAGRTTLVTADGKTIVLLDTTGSNINAADFEYIADQHLLLIPTFFDNRVAAYKIE